jgi:acetylornithine deacetylase
LPRPVRGKKSSTTGGIKRTRKKKERTKVATVKVVETLEKMIAFPTISNRPITELAAMVAERCETLGFSVEMFVSPLDETKVNVVCTAGPDDADGLILSGHMDVVPTAGQPWSSDPFKLSEREGKLYGRGTADMKGFIASTFHALDRLDLSNLKKQVVLVWTHDEEVGCQGSAQLVRELKALERKLPTQAIIGEPTDFRVLRMHPGHVTLDVTTTGAAAHSSKPDLGASAIKAMQRVLDMIEALEIELQQNRRLENFLERPWTTLNAGVISGGKAINLVPDSCTLSLGYRPLPGDEPLEVFDKLTERIEALSLPRGTSASMSILNVTPALLTPEGTPLQNTLMGHSSHNSCASASFATDGGNLSALGVNSLIFGPGSIDVAHKADEYIRLHDLVSAVDKIESIVRAHCM